MSFFFGLAFFTQCFASCGSNSSFFIAAYYSVLCIHHELLMYSPVEGIRVALSLGLLSIKLAMNIHVHVFWWTYTLLSLRYILRNRSTGLQDRQVLKFSKYCQRFPKWQYQFTLPQAICYISGGSNPSPALETVVPIDLDILVGLWMYLTVLRCSFYASGKLTF